MEQSSKLDPSSFEGNTTSELNLPEKTPKQKTPSVENSQEGTALCT